jgi:hypothetical protein
VIGEAARGLRDEIDQPAKNKQLFFEPIPPAVPSCLMSVRVKNFCRNQTKLLQTKGFDSPALLTYKNV